MPGVLSTEMLDDAQLSRRPPSREMPSDWVQAVKPDGPYDWDQTSDWPRKVERGDGLHVVAHRLRCEATSSATLIERRREGDRPPPEHHRRGDPEAPPRRPLRLQRPPTPPPSTTR